MKGKGKKFGMSISLMLRFRTYFVSGNWDYRTVVSQRVIKFKYPHKIMLNIWHRYWLKTRNVHSALEQNTECSYSLPKHKLQVSVVNVKQEII